MWHFEIFLNTGPYGLDISKCYSSYSFHPVSANLTRSLATMVVQAITFLVNQPSFKKLKILGHFEILTCESTGKFWNVQYLENGSL